MVPLAFVTLVTPVFANIAVAPAPDGTVAGFQLDDVTKEPVVPTQVWAATPVGDRQVAASKAAPWRLMDAGRIGRIVARASRLERWPPDFMVVLPLMRFKS